MHQPIERLRAMAADLLINLLDHPPDGPSPAHRVVLSTRLVVRDSCGAMGNRVAVTVAVPSICS